MENVWQGLLGAVIVGAVAGSFLTMLVVRLPAIDYQAGSSFWQIVRALSVPRSYCDHCKTPLKARMLVPVFSYIAFHGKCGFCKRPIAPWVWVLELLSISLAVFLLWQQGITVEALWLLLLFLGLLVLSFIDARIGLLPDELTLPLLWLGLLVNSTGMFSLLTDAVLGAAFGYGVLWLVYQCYYLLTKKEGLGHGDFKLFAVVGAWFGWQSLPVVLVVACGVALLWVLWQKMRGQAVTESIAFGPFISLAVFVVWAFTLAPWWWQLWA